MKVIKEGGLTELIKIVKTSLNGKEPNISKKSGFNLVKTDAVENDTNKLFTAKGAFDLKTVITNAYTSLVTSTRTALETSIATKTAHGGYAGTSQQLKNEIDNKLPNPGYGGVHELGRYLDLHLSGSTADYDTRISANTDKSLLVQNTNGNLEIGPKNASHCHIYTDRPNFYFNKELMINGNQVYHAGYKPGKADVGLGSVNNWGASSDINNNSTTTYATTNMVAQIKANLFGRDEGNGGLDTLFNSSNLYSGSVNNDTTSLGAIYPWGAHITGGGRNACLQLYSPHSGGNQLFFRRRWSGEKGPWYKIYHEGFKPSAADVGAMADGGQYSTLKLTNWIRTVGSCGWYSQSYGGGIHMSDSTWVRIYNGKNFYVGSSSPDAIHSAGGVNVAGRIIGSQVFNAVWNDYAEFFPKKKGYTTEAGDIIALCEDDDGEYYELATSSHCMIVGAHSDCFGHLIGGEKPPLGEDFVEWNKDNYIPVALVGRLPVKFMGVAKKGMKVVPSETPGVGRAFGYGDSYDNVIGYIVENNNEEGIRRVKIKIGK